MTLRRPKIVVLVVITVIVVVLIGGLLVRAIAKNQAYSLLEDSVASQSFADGLGKPQRTSRECYPADGRQDYCPTLSYELTDKTCKQLSVAFKELSCNNYSDVVKTFKGKPITYSVATSEQNNTLDVYVNEVSRLY